MTPHSVGQKRPFYEPEIFFPTAITVLGRIVVMIFFNTGSLIKLGNFLFVLGFFVVVSLNICQHYIEPHL